MPPLNILIADDHAAIRRNVRTLLEGVPGWNCAEVSSGTEALESVRDLRPDIVLLDVALPGVNGFEAARQILREAPNTSVLILTMYNSDEVRTEASRAGARGIVLKSEASDSLVNAIESVIENGS